MAAVQFPDAVLRPSYNVKDWSVVSEKELVAERDHLKPSIEQEESRYIVMSPYTEQSHLLDLHALGNEDRILGEALQGFRCLREDYATSPYLETFNWDEVIGQVKQLALARNYRWKKRSFYIVAFRSQIPPTTVYADLGALDKAAHAEATASGGFLKYWFGTPNHELRNLATCIWRSQEDARKGGVGPAHRRAAGATRALYSFWKIDRHRLTIHDDVSSWEIVDWTD